MMKQTKLFATVLAVLSLIFLQACEGSIGGSGKVTQKANGDIESSVEVNWKITFLTGLAGESAFNASQFVVTREVDPNHLSYSNGTRYGTLILDLANGSTVSYSGALQHSSYWSNQIPPADPSKQVLAFVAANTSALQNFLNQYGSQATDAEFDSTIVLDNIYAGSSTVTKIDSQVSYQGNREFAYRGSIRIGGAGGPGGPPPYFGSTSLPTNEASRGK